MNSFDTSDQMDFNNLSNMAGQINSGVQELNRNERMANSNMATMMSDEKSMLESIREGILNTGASIGRSIANGVQQTGQFINRAYQANKRDFEVWNPERSALRAAAIATGPIGVAITRMIQNMDLNFSGLGNTLKNGIGGIGRGIGSIASMFKSKDDSGMDSRNLHSGPQLPEQLLSQQNRAMSEQTQAFGSFNKQSIANTDRLIQSVDQIRNEICGINDSRTGRQSEKQKDEKRTAILASAGIDPTTGKHTGNNGGGGAGGFSSLGQTLSDIRDIQQRMADQQEEYHTDNEGQTSKFESIFNKVAGFENMIANVMGTNGILMKWTSFFHGKYSKDIPRSKNPLNTLVNASLKIYEWNRIYGDVTHRQLNELIKLQGGRQQNLVGDKSPFSVFVRNRMKTLKNVVQEALWGNAKKGKGGIIPGMATLNKLSGGLLSKVTGGVFNVFGRSIVNGFGGDSEEDNKNQNRASQIISIQNRARKKKGLEKYDANYQWGEAVISDELAKKIVDIYDGTDADEDEKDEQIAKLLSQDKKGTSKKHKKNFNKLRSNARFQQLLATADEYTRQYNLARTDEEGKKIQKEHAKYMASIKDELSEIAEAYGIKSGELFGDNGKLGGTKETFAYKATNMLDRWGLGGRFLHPFGLSVDKESFKKDDWSNLLKNGSYQLLKPDSSSGIEHEEPKSLEEKYSKNIADLVRALEESEKGIPVRIINFEDESRSEAPTSPLSPPPEPGSGSPESPTGPPEHSTSSSPSPEPSSGHSTSPVPPEPATPVQPAPSSEPRTPEEASAPTPEPEKLGFKGKIKKLVLDYFTKIGEQLEADESHADGGVLTEKVLGITESGKSVEIAEKGPEVILSGKKSSDNAKTIAAIAKEAVENNPIAVPDSISSKNPVDSIVTQLSIIAENTRKTSENTETLTDGTSTALESGKITEIGRELAAVLDKDNKNDAVSAAEQAKKEKKELELEAREGETKTGSVNPIIKTAKDTAKNAEANQKQLQLAIEEKQEREKEKKKAGGKGIFGWMKSLLGGLKDLFSSGDGGGLFGNIAKLAGAGLLIYGAIKFVPAIWELCKKLPFFDKEVQEHTSTMIAAATSVGALLTTGKTNRTLELATAAANTVDSVNRFSNANYKPKEVDPSQLKPAETKPAETKPTPVVEAAQTPSGPRGRSTYVQPAPTRRVRGNINPYQAVAGSNPAQTVATIQDPNAKTEEINMAPSSGGARAGLLAANAYMMARGHKFKALPVDAVSVIDMGSVISGDYVEHKAKEAGWSNQMAGTAGDLTTKAVNGVVLNGISSASKGLGNVLIRSTMDGAKMVAAIDAGATAADAVAAGTSTSLAAKGATVAGRGAQGLGSAVGTAAGIFQVAMGIADSYKRAKDGDTGGAIIAGVGAGAAGAIMLYSACVATVPGVGWIVAGIGVATSAILMLWDWAKEKSLEKLRRDIDTLMTDGEFLSVTDPTFCEAWTKLLEAPKTEDNLRAMVKFHKAWQKNARFRVHVKNIKQFAAAHEVFQKECSKAINETVEYVKQAGVEVDIEAFRTTLTLGIWRQWKNQFYAKLGYDHIMSVINTAMADHYFIDDPKYKRAIENYQKCSSTREPSDDARTSWTAELYFICATRYFSKEKEVREDTKAQALEYAASPEYQDSLVEAVQEIYGAKAAEKTQKDIQRAREAQAKVGESEYQVKRYGSSAKLTAESLQDLTQEEFGVGKAIQDDKDLGKLTEKAVQALQDQEFRQQYAKEISLVQSAEQLKERKGDDLIGLEITRELDDFGRYKKDELGNVIESKRHITTLSKAGELQIAALYKIFQKHKEDAEYDDSYVKEDVFSEQGQEEFYKKQVHAATTNKLGEAATKVLRNVRLNSIKATRALKQLYKIPEEQRTDEQKALIQNFERQLEENNHFELSWQRYGPAVMARLQQADRYADGFDTGGKGANYDKALEALNHGDFNLWAQHEPHASEWMLAGIEHFGGFAVPGFWAKLAKESDSNWKWPYDSEIRMDKMLQRMQGQKIEGWSQFQGLDYVDESELGPIQTAEQLREQVLNARERTIDELDPDGTLRAKALMASQRNFGALSAVTKVASENAEKARKERELHDPGQYLYGYFKDFDNGVSKVADYSEGVTPNQRVGVNLPIDYYKVVDTGPSFEKSSDSLASKVENFVSSGSQTVGTAVSTREAQLKPFKERRQILQEKLERYRLGKKENRTKEEESRFKALEEKYGLKAEEMADVNLLKSGYNTNDRIDEEIAKLYKAAGGHKEKLSKEDLQKLNSLEKLRKLSDEDRVKLETKLQWKLDNGSSAPINLTNDERDELTHLNGMISQREKSIEKSRMSAFMSEESSKKAILSLPYKQQLAYFGGDKEALNKFLRDNGVKQESKSVVAAASLASAGKQQISANSEQKQSEDESEAKALLSKKKLLQEKKYKGYSTIGQTTVHGQTVYTWKDANGKVHKSSRKPTDTQLQEGRLSEQEEVELSALKTYLDENGQLTEAGKQYVKQQKQLAAEAGKKPESVSAAAASAAQHAEQQGMLTEEQLKKAAKDRGINGPGTYKWTPGDKLAVKTGEAPDAKGEKTSVKSGVQKAEDNADNLDGKDLVDLHGDLVPKFFLDLIKHKKTSITDDEIAQIENSILHGKRSADCFQAKLHAYGYALGLKKMPYGDAHKAIHKIVSQLNIKNAIIADNIRNVGRLAHRVAYEKTIEKEESTAKKLEKSKSASETAANVAKDQKDTKSEENGSNPVETAKKVSIEVTPEQQKAETKELLKERYWLRKKKENGTISEEDQARLDKINTLVTSDKQLTEEGQKYVQDKLQKEAEEEAKRKAKEEARLEVIRKKAAARAREELLKEESEKLQKANEDNKLIKERLAEKAANRRKGVTVGNEVSEYDQDLLGISGSNLGDEENKSLTKTAGEVSAETAKNESGATSDINDLTVTTVHGQEVYVWKDSKGKVHRSTIKPAGAPEGPVKRYVPPSQRPKHNYVSNGINDLSTVKMHGQDIYVWKDNDGKVHRSTIRPEQAPDGQKSKLMQDTDAANLKILEKEKKGDQKSVASTAQDVTEEKSQSEAGEQSQELREKYKFVSAEEDKARIDSLIAKKFRGNEHLETKRKLEAAQAELDKFNQDEEKGKTLDKLIEEQNATGKDPEKMRKALAMRKAREKDEKEFEELSEKDSRFRALSEKQNKSSDEIAELEQLSLTRDKDLKRLNVHVSEKKAKEDKERKYRELLEKEKSGEISKEEREQLSKMDKERIERAKFEKETEGLDEWEARDIKIRELANQKQFLQNSLSTASRIHDGQNGLDKDEEEELKYLQGRRERYLELTQRIPSTATKLDPITAARLAAENGGFLDDHKGSGVSGNQSAIIKAIDARDQKYEGFDAVHEALSPEEEGASFSNESILSTQIGDRQSALVRQSAMDVGAKGSFTALDTATKLQSEGFADLRGSMDGINEYQSEMMRLVQENKGMLPVSVLDNPALEDIMDKQKKEARAKEIADKISSVELDDETLRKEFEQNNREKERTVSEVAIYDAIQNMSEEDIAKMIDDYRANYGPVMGDAKLIEEFGKTNAEAFFQKGKRKMSKYATMTNEQVNALAQDRESDLDYRASDVKAEGDAQRASASYAVNFKDADEKFKADKLNKLAEFDEARQADAKKNADAIENKFITSADGKSTTIMSALKDSYIVTSRDYDATKKWLDEKKDWSDETMTYDKMHKEMGFIYDESLKKKMGPKNYELYMKKIGRTSSVLTGANDEEIQKKVKEAESDKEFTSSSLYRKIKSQAYSENFTERDKSSVLLAAYEEFQNRKKTFVPELGVSVHSDLYNALKSLPDGIGAYDDSGVSFKERVFSQLKDMVSTYGDEALLGDETGPLLAQSIQDSLKEIQKGEDEYKKGSEEAKKEPTSETAKKALDAAKESSRSALNLLDIGIRAAEEYATGNKHSVNAVTYSVNTLTGKAGMQSKSFDVRQTLHESKLRGSDQTLLGDKSQKYWKEKQESEKDEAEAEAYERKILEQEKKEVESDAVAKAARDKDVQENSLLYKQKEDDKQLFISQAMERDANHQENLERVASVALSDPDFLKWANGGQEISGKEYYQNVVDDLIPKNDAESAFGVHPEEETKTPQEVIFEKWQKYQKEKNELETSIGHGKNAIYADATKEAARSTVYMGGDGGSILRADWQEHLWNVHKKHKDKSGLFTEEEYKEKPWLKSTYLTDLNHEVGVDDSSPEWREKYRAQALADEKGAREAWFQNKAMNGEATYNPQTQQWEANRSATLYEQYTTPGFGLGLDGKTGYDLYGNPIVKETMPASAAYVMAQSNPQIAAKIHSDRPRDISKGMEAANMQSYLRSTSSDFVDGVYSPLESPAISTESIPDFTSDAGGRAGLTGLTSSLMECGVVPVIDGKTGQVSAVLTTGVEAGKEAAFDGSKLVKAYNESLDQEKLQNANNVNANEVREVKKLEKAHEKISAEVRSVATSTTSAITNSTKKMSTSINTPNITNVNVSNDPNVFVDNVVGTSSGNVIR